MMTQMREQSRQIIILINVVSQLVSAITKFKRKLIVMFSTSEEFSFTDIQRVSSKRVVKLTNRAQTIRIEFVKIKRTKIHEKSIESLISLNLETTQFKQKNALFVNNNKHVSSQSNRDDSLISVLSSTNLSISNQSSFESLVVVELDHTHESVFVFASILEIELNSTHQ
jgi:hypothetical protein